MKLLLDSEGKVNYDKITGSSTVMNFLDAIDIFLRDNKLPCGTCEESCCKKPWSVEMDNICVNRLSNWDKEAVKRFVKNKLVLKENFAMEFDQYVMKKETSCSFVTVDNLCTIYEKRPIICRLYICSARSHRYNAVRELIAAVYLKALVMEEEMRSNACSQEMVNQYRRNPAVFVRDYDMRFDELLDYALEEDWLDAVGARELYREL